MRDGKRGRGRAEEEEGRRGRRRRGRRWGFTPSLPGSLQTHTCTGALHLTRLFQSPNNGSLIHLFLLCPRKGRGTMLGAYGHVGGRRCEKDTGANGAENEAQISCVHWRCDKILVHRLAL
ncbi:hypothetical protein Taro_010819 [Colocasia esculenta]|uniref:Uncharacterized protein n=1 Tax=Colocasia esculenta TaxID=4460 RepID=A0A843U8I2_COLES|nr:hypothetical protein [Colocasia esculenta]